MRARPLRDVGLHAILALAYFAAARLSLALGAVSDHVTPVWPPSGIALALLLLYGNRLWPGIAAAAFVLYLTAGLPVPAAAGIAAGNTVAALAGVWLIRRMGGVEPSLGRTRDVLRLAGGAVLASPVAALVGTAILTATGAIASPREAGVRLLTWWLGDAAGILLVAPVLLTWLSPPPAGARSPRATEVIAFSAVVGLSGYLIVAGGLPYSYALFPILMYAALGFGPRGAAATTLALAAIAVATADSAPGAALHESVAHLVGFTALASGAALLLAAAVAERGALADRDVENLNLLQMVFGTIDAVFVKDREGRYLMANAATARVAGRSPEAMLGANDYELFPPEVSVLAVSADRAVIAAGVPRTLEETFTLGDRTFHFLTTRAPYRDAGGAIIGVIGIARDVSEFKHAEERLRQSEEKFRTLIESAPEFICSVDREGRFEFLNRTARGFDAEELVRNATVFDHVPSPYRERIREALDRVFETGEGGRYETLGVGDDGAPAWYHCTVGPIMDGRRVKSAMVIATDVTAQKAMEDRLRESEERFRSLVENAPDFIATFDSDGRILFINRAARGRGDIVGKTAFDFIPEPDRERVGSEVERILGTGAPGTVEVEWALPGQELRRYRCRIGPLAGTGPARALVIASDVTESTRAERELLFSRERLQHLSRRLIDIQETERRHIARELHDDIGQALTAIKMSLQAACRRGSGAGVLSQIEESIGIVDEALERVRSLSVSLRPSLLDDLGLVPALRWYLDQQAGRAGFRSRFEADLDVEAPSDVQTACFRIAQEALTNTARHAQASSVLLEVRSLEGELHLRVADDGRGFDVLGAFARAGGDASLGLLGMRERARLLGGRVTVQSEPAKGTVIHARFPLGGVQ